MTSNARNVYERIEQNQMMAVTADQVIVDSGATTALLKIGINHQAKPANQPYAGIWQKAERGAETRGERRRR